MRADVFNMNGEVVGDVELSDEIFGIEPNEYVVHEAVVAYLSNQRQGTQSAKTRAEVSGGGRKPWRQKGTGRARVGSSRNPIWRHGGVAFPPKPRKYTKKINRKAKRLALKSAFSSKASEGSLFIVDKLEFEAPKTKAMIAVLESLNAPKPLVVIEGKNLNVEKSVSNIPNASCLTVGTMNVYEILKHNSLILTLGALERITEVYS
ncbi:MAG: 50S ribosomal protein L4 [Eubacteriaceae bacterium]|jgi:large subunit ribosomal protein L4|nr:50S ribosomal protein L4 [Eubacteriaceae bacterium]